MPSLEPLRDRNSLIKSAAIRLLAVCRDWCEVEKLAQLLASNRVGEPGTAQWIRTELASALFTIHDQENK